MLFFTDPLRIPDPEAAAARLPRGAAVVFRAFGAPDALVRGRRLKSIAQRGGLTMLIGADARLAAALDADGVHLPERLAGEARRLKAARPHWIITVAAHSLPAARRAASGGADAVVISAVFQSRSASARRPLGPLRLARMVREVGIPAYALGGVTNETARRLSGAGLVGLAAVDGLAGPRT